MPTKKPRVYVTFERSTYKLLKEHSELTGQPVSSYVSEIMLQTEPMIEKANSFYRLVNDFKRAPEKASEEAIDELQRQMLSIADDYKKQLSNVVELQPKK